ncbi:MAG: alpha/beta hydrolase [Gemmatimonadetes bacterium]|nr:alpha/beta hydrolase [Gemmatimonadota bacterium]MCC6770771.1 alpha/beta hydrolase [Gemmatimonadaceae bacterium]
MRITTATFAAVSACLVVLWAAPIGAQELETRPVPLGQVEAFTFQSPSMGVTFSVSVGLPPGYKAGDGKSYQALISTDGDWAFSSVNTAARSLAGVIESPFVISIGTGADEGEALWTRRRIYEFSPPDWDMKDTFGQLVSKLCADMKTEPSTCVGGAPKFLNVIVSELMPLVSAKYPIDRSQLGLFGVSAGGFFASWAIFQPNSPFKKYLISSPAMAYGDGDIFRQEARYAKDHTDLPVGIYLAAGVLEASDADLEGVGRIVSGTAHLAGVLAGRKYPGLTVVTEFHPGMGHVDVVGTAVVRGLRTLYAR